MLTCYVLMMSKFKGKKTNNAKTNVKEKLRLSILGVIDNPSVLEVFCGSGDMYNKVWNKADSYTGIDKIKYFDKRETICGDALKAVSSIDLTRYNIFDIDAYGSPYQVLQVIISRLDRSKKEFGFTITDGSSMDLRLGRISKGLRYFTGINFHVAKKAGVLHDLFIKDVVAKIENDLNGVCSNMLIAKGKTGAAVRYYAFKLTINDVV